MSGDAVGNVDNNVTGNVLPQSAWWDPRIRAFLPGLLGGTLPRPALDDARSL
jgi:hypothetical protein